MFLQITYEKSFLVWVYIAFFTKAVTKVLILFLAISPFRI